MTDEDRQRRRRAKRFNERVKLASAFLNTLGVASLVTLLLAPFASGYVTLERGLRGIVLALVLHASGQLILLLWRSED